MTKIINYMLKEADIIAFGILQFYAVSLSNEG